MSWRSVHFFQCVVQVGQGIRLVLAAFLARHHGGQSCGQRSLLGALPHNVRTEDPEENEDG